MRVLGVESETRSKERWSVDAGTSTPPIVTATVTRGLFAGDTVVPGMVAVIPANKEVEGLEWMLLTTVEVKHKADAYERLEWYAKRWGIEVYHRILKSGCRVEARQLEKARPREGPV